jgi:hypothetical protein
MHILPKAALYRHELEQWWNGAFGGYAKSSMRAPAYLVVEVRLNSQARCSKHSEQSPWVVLNTTGVRRFFKKSSSML